MSFSPPFCRHFCYPRRKGRLLPDGNRRNYLYCNYFRLGDRGLEPATSCVSSRQQPVGTGYRICTCVRRHSRLHHSLHQVGGRRRPARQGRPRSCRNRDRLAGVTRGNPSGDRSYGPGHPDESLATLVALLICRAVMPAILGSISSTPNSVPGLSAPPT